MFRVLRSIRCSNPPTERARARTPGTWRAAMRHPPNRVGDLVAQAGRHSNPSHQDRVRRDSPWPSLVRFSFEVASIGCKRELTSGYPIGFISNICAFAGCMTKSGFERFFLFLPLKIVVIYTTYAKPHHRSTSCSSPPTPFPNRRPRSNPTWLHHRTIR